MSITSYTGEQLLDAKNLEAIKKEADLILQNKDVAGAWQASRHIKMQLASLPADRVKPLLPDYRALTANLKALSLPLLGWDEVKNLIANNLAFLDSKYLPVLSAGLLAWLATQSDADKKTRREEILKLLPDGSPLRSGLVANEEPKAAPASVVVKISDHGGLFDKEESHELAGHAQKIGEMNAAPILARGASMGAAENILTISQSTEDKATFLRRANALIASRLRDVRTKTDLREYLSRPFKVGGLGLKPEILDKVGGLIEDEYNKLHTQLAPKPTPPYKVEKIEIVELSLPARIATRSVAGGPPSVAPRPTIKEEAPPLPAPVPAPAQAPPVAMAKATESAPPKIEPARIATQNVAGGPVPDAQRVVRPVRIPLPSDKPRVEDIKSAPARIATQNVAGGPRTTSAVDELKFLTIEDWRQLGTPDEAVKNIWQKVELLGKESITAKGQGIKMFRESALFQQYVALGRATLAQGKKLADALADRAINPGNITQDEFFAIALLNGKLK